METPPETPTATPVPEAEPTPEPARTEPPPENLVGEAKRKQKAAEKEATELRDRLEALEDKDRSETERERKAREKAEAEAAVLGSRVKSLERGGWVRSAAAEKGFNDPDDAVAFANLDDIEDERDAARAVKALAEKKPHLLKPSDPTPPQIGKVLEGGQPTSPGQQTPAREAEVEQAKQFAGELKKLTNDWQ